MTKADDLREMGEALGTELALDPFPYADALDQMAVVLRECDRVFTELGYDKGKFPRADIHKLLFDAGYGVYAYEVLKDETDI